MHARKILFIGDSVRQVPHPQANTYLDHAHGQRPAAAITLHYEARVPRAAPEHVGVGQQARRSEHLHQAEDRHKHAALHARALRHPALL